MGIPLYGDARGDREFDATGVRLEAVGRDPGPHLVPTRERYQVGHYARWGWSAGAAPIGPAWVREAATGRLRRLWDASALFDGGSAPPPHAAEPVGIVIEPGHLRLRPGDTAPVRVLRHVADGTATWTEVCPRPPVVSDDTGVVTSDGSAVTAAALGTAVLRCALDGHHAEAVVEVGWHRSGATTAFLTGLPPVTGLAWTPAGLVVGTGRTGLWRVGTDGGFGPLPPIPAGGVDAIAARVDGELAVRLAGDPRLLVLHRADGYRSSRPVDAGTGIAAFTWAGDDLVVVAHTGAVHRVGASGALGPRVAVVGGTPVDTTWAGDALLVLCAATPGSSSGIPRTGVGSPGGTHLWQVSMDSSGTPVDLLAGVGATGISGVHWTGPQALLTDFDGGHLLRLRDGALSVVAEGLVTPGQVTTAGAGDIYVAEFAAGAVRRVFG